MEARVILDWGISQNKLMLAQRIKTVAPDKLKFTLSSDIEDMYAYQKQGVAYAYVMERCVIGDATGLGKTIEAIGLFHLLKSRGEMERGIMFCLPASVYQVRDEFTKWAPKLSVGVVDGEKYKRYVTYNSNYDVLLIPYSIVYRDFDIINEYLRPDVVVMDEISVCKNNKAQISGLMKQINYNAKRAVGLSATPIQNSFLDVHSIFSVLGIPSLGSDEFFRYYFCRWENAGKYGRGKIVGYRNIEELKNRVLPFMIRRTVADVEQALPVVLTHTVRLDLYEEQKVAVRNIKQGFINEMGKMKHIAMVAALHYMQAAVDGLQTLDSAAKDISIKLDWIVGFAQQAEEKIVVFSRYKRTINSLIKRLDAVGVEYVVITGDVNDKQVRRELQLRFEKDPNVKVLIGTSALEMSLNLQTARYMVCIDLIYNPARLTQLLGRIRRLGSPHRSVVIVYLFCNGSHEFRMLKLIEKKQALADYMFSERSDLFNSLSDAEVRWIFEGVLGEGNGN